jgi:hypothetical protein
MDYDTVMYMVALTLVWPVGWLTDWVLRNRQILPN